MFFSFHARTIDKHAQAMNSTGILYYYVQTYHEKHELHVYIEFSQLFDHNLSAQNMACQLIPTNDELPMKLSLTQTAL